MSKWTKRSTRGCAIRFKGMPRTSTSGGSFGLLPTESEVRQVLALIDCEENSRLTSVSNKQRLTTVAVTTEGWVFAYRRLALIIVCLAALFGSIGARFGGRVDALAAITIASGLVLWCTLDAHIRGKTFVHSFAWALALTWPLGVLVHLVWTRRWRGVRIYVGMVVTFMIVQVLVKLLAEGLQQ